VREALGPGSRITGVEPLSTEPGRAVLRVTVSGAAGRLVVKVTTGAVAGRADDPERTAAATALASAAGVPTAEVLAARTPRDGEPGYLVQRHVDGVEWRRVRPTLSEDEVRSVHRQIAGAVLALQSVRLPAFGDLGSADGAGLLPALRRRADRLVADPDRRAAFAAVLDREAALFTGDRPTLVHDDLHHDNVVLTAVDGGWRLAGVLDWDKAWAGPAESDVARMAFWDGMTGPGFWEVYRAAVPEREGWARRALVHQLLWCLEYAVPTERHRSDTAAVGAALDWPV
jgi:aminoglycoside phosphotransferase (APT) family kinase protein